MRRGARETAARETGARETGAKRHRGLTRVGRAGEAWPITTTMGWVLQEREIWATLAADSRRRCEYFVHRVLETRRVWGLYDDGWAALGDEGRPVLPFWPHETYAHLFRGENLADYVPRAIGLEVFLDECLPEMRRTGVGVAVFPVPDGEAVILPVDKLEAILRPLAEDPA